MKTRCPECRTIFRVTPEQLKARDGKVRCGQCQIAFNAHDHLLEEAAPSSPETPVPVPEPALPEPQPPAEAPRESVAEETREDNADPGIDILLEPIEPAIDPDRLPPLSESEAQALGKATGLIAARETTDVPGYSKWTEGVMAAPVIAAPEKSARWPFILAAVLLTLVLAGQMVFHFRSDIAASAPVTRPPLAALSRAFGAEIPLPRHAERVSIEASDLQNDATNSRLLVLNATLRNRASYEQEYPDLELTLTDTQDAAIARRVFRPAEYLSAKRLAEEPFAANADIAVRLWIETKDMTPAGYRLYVFYP